MTTALWPVLAQSSATGALDSFIGGLNMSADRAAIFVLVFAIVVILIVLGTEFWMNLYGLITAPSVAASRIMGEQQLLPNLFVVLMSGIALAIFALLIIPTQAYIDNQKDALAQVFAAISQQYASMGVPYVPSAFNFELDDIRLSVMKSLGFFLLVPLTFALFWYSWGIGVLLSGKLIGMRNAAGVNNAVCGLAWPILLWPIMFWASAQAQIFGNGIAWGLYGIVLLLHLFWILTIAREFYRVGWVPTIIGVLLSLVIACVVFAVVFTVLLMFFGILKEQLPQYV